jgi:hypothetical protein
MAAFLDLVSKDFGELGSLLCAYPRLRSVQTVGRRHSKTPRLRSGRLELTVEQSEFEQAPKVCEQNRKECPFCDRACKRGNRAAVVGQKWHESYVVARK